MHPEQELDRQLRGHVCSHDHPHQELLGGVKVAQSARYPKRMAQWLAGYFLRPEEPADVRRLRCELLAAGTVPSRRVKQKSAQDDVPMREYDEFAEVPDLPSGEKEACIATIARLHHEMGHPQQEVGGHRS